MYLILAVLLLFQASPAFENEFVQVFKNSAPCASAGPTCAERIIVALGSVDFNGKKLSRGDIHVFAKGEKYVAPKGGDFLEVVMRPTRPPVKTSPVKIAPDKNTILYDGQRFFIFEEKLPVGDTRERHSHNQRLVVTVNETKLQQWVDGQADPIFRDSIPDNIGFNQPVVHVTKNIGKNPMRNIVIELKP